VKQLRAKTYLENKRLVEINYELLDNHLPHSELQQKIPHHIPNNTTVKIKVGFRKIQSPTAQRQLLRDDDETGDDQKQ
jgi:hypothetical protein